MSQPKFRQPMLLVNLMRLLEVQLYAASSVKKLGDNIKATTIIRRAPEDSQLKGAN